MMAEQKQSAARSRKQKFIDEYTEKFPFVRKSLKGDTYAFCNVCRVDISVACGGSNDIKRHSEKKKHVEMVEASRKSRPLSSFFPCAKSEDLTVISAEVLFSD